MQANCTHCFLREPRKAKAERCMRHEFREAAGDSWHDCPLYRGPTPRALSRAAGRVQRRSLLNQQEVLV